MVDLRTWYSYIMLLGLGIVPCFGKDSYQTSAFRKAAAHLPAQWALYQKMRIRNDYPCDSEPEHAVLVVS
jgi:hypothetical protein